MSIPTSPDDLVPKKGEVENAQKAFAFFKKFVENVEYLRQLKDVSLEQVFQHGGRPKSGRSNDPDRFYTSEAHDVALIKKAIPGLLLDAGLLNPPKTLYEWTFVRFHLDLKIMAEASKDVLENYLRLLEDGAEEAEKEAGELGTKYDLTKEMALREDFHQLTPPQHHYFTCLLNKVVLRSLRMMLSVVYCYWYPEEEQTT